MKSVLERIASKNLAVFKLLNEFFELQDKVFYLPYGEGFNPRNISSDEAPSTINVIRIRFCRGLTCPLNTTRFSL